MLATSILPCRRCLPTTDGTSEQKDHDSGSGDQFKCGNSAGEGSGLDYLHSSDEGRRKGRRAARDGTAQLQAESAERLETISPHAVTGSLRSASNARAPGKSCPLKAQHAGKSAQEGDIATMARRTCDRILLDLSHVRNRLKLPAWLPTHKTHCLQQGVKRRTSVAVPYRFPLERVLHLPAYSLLAWFYWHRLIMARQAEDRIQLYFGALGLWPDRALVR